MGQNDSTYWAEATEYSVPQTTAPAGGWNVGTIADYMGIPTGVANIKVTSLPFRAYARIWNEWFRDENLQQPVVQDTDDTNDTGSNTGTELTDAEHGGLPLKVAKYHDYFTSCLPEPQKGEAAAIPVNLKTAFSDGIPVVSGDSWNANGLTPQPMKFDLWTSGQGAIPGGETISYLGMMSDTKNGEPPFNLIADASSRVTYNSDQDAWPYPNNLWARTDLANIEGLNITINELRQAIALQHILEADARGGTRYTEILQHQFGVTSPDARLQRSEYLGGTRVPININQVIQQSASRSPRGERG